MPQIDTHGRPVAGSERIDQIVRADTDLRFTLTAEREASLEFGRMTKQSSGGTPVTGTENVSGAGDHTISLSSEGGHLELRIQASDGSQLLDFSCDDQEPCAHQWTFTAQPNWTGGSVSEEGNEIAQKIVAGEAPSQEPSGEIPERSAPATPAEITRPWAPEKESEPYAPRKAENPVFDSKDDRSTYGTSLGDYEEKTGANKEPGGDPSKKGG